MIIKSLESPMASESSINSIIFSTEDVGGGRRAWPAQSRNLSFNRSVDNGLSGEADGGCNSMVAEFPLAQTTSISAQPFGAPCLLSASTRSDAAKTAE